MVYTLSMSISNAIVKCLLRLSGTSKDVSEATFCREMRENAAKERRAAMRVPHCLGVRVELGVYCGMNYFIFIPRETDTNNAILYIHGSGYMNAYRRVQLRFAADLAKNLHAKVYFPLYPKLPVATARVAYALLKNFYAFLYKKGEVFLIGDSSGGALALSLTADHPSVRSVIAISPWVRLDVSEEGRKVEGDLILSLSKLDYTAKLWRDDLDGGDVRVSPIFGHYEGRDIILFAGEKEVFRPDILDLFHEHSARGATVTYVEGRDGQHCYPLMPTKEGRSARRAIYEKIGEYLYGERS